MARFARPECTPRQELNCVDCLLTKTQIIRDSDKNRQQQAENMNNSRNKLFRQTIPIS